MAQNSQSRIVIVNIYVKSLQWSLRFVPSKCHRSDFIMPGGWRRRGASHHFLFCDFLPLCPCSAAQCVLSTTPFLNSGPYAESCLHVPPCSRSAYAVTGISAGKSLSDSWAHTGRNLDSTDGQPSEVPSCLHHQ